MPSYVVYEVQMKRVYERRRYLVYGDSEDDALTQVERGEGLAWEEEEPLGSIPIGSVCGRVVYSHPIPHEDAYAAAFGVLVEHVIEEIDG